MMNPLICLFPLLSSLLVASTPTAFQDVWTAWKFLLGERNDGESSGVPGQAGKGGFALTGDLGGDILVRKNHAEYPATAGGPPLSHDDLMIVYRDSGATQAFCDDSEDRVIHYDVTVSPDKKEIVFLSVKGAAGPRYRLTYDDMQPSAVRVLFEIAPGDKPGQFVKYVEAIVRRK